MLAGMHAAFSP